MMAQAPRDAESRGAFFVLDFCGAGILPAGLRIWNAAENRRRDAGATKIPLPDNLQKYATILVVTL